MPARSPNDAWSAPACWDSASSREHHLRPPSSADGRRVLLAPQLLLAARPGQGRGRRVTGSFDTPRPRQLAQGDACDRAQGPARTGLPTLRARGRRLEGGEYPNEGEPRHDPARRLGGRPAATGDPAPARPRAEEADPDQPRRVPLRRRALGQARQAGARRLRRDPARPRRRGAPARPAAARDPGDSRGPQVRPRGGARRARLRADGPGQPAPRLRRHGRHRADPLPDRRHDQARAARAHRGADLGRRAGPRASTTCSCRRCPTTCSPATPRPGSTTASRSTPCASGPGCARPSTTRRSTAGTPTSPTPTSTSGPRARSTARPPPRAATSSSSAAAPCWSA